MLNKDDTWYHIYLRKQNLTGWKLLCLPFLFELDIRSVFYTGIYLSPVWDKGYYFEDAKNMWTLSWPYNNLVLTYCKPNLAWHFIRLFNFRSMHGSFFKILYEFFLFFFFFRLSWQNRDPTLIFSKIKAIAD